MSVGPPASAALRRWVAVHRRLDNDTYAAFALATATLIALAWANLGSSYSTLWSTEAAITVGHFGISMSLAEWVNEGLMTVFFFSVGLDVRREVTIGELRDRGRAALPAYAALGGLVAPSVVFLLFTHGQPTASAWGTVISTDTAFALGMLALVGPRNAPRLKVFLLTFAVVDDIGALSVIAMFYTEHLDLVALAGAGLGMFMVWRLQRRGVWRVTPFLVLGVATWCAMQASGVHATLTGVLLALLMPVYPQRAQDAEHASQLVHLFRQAPVPRAARVVRRSIDYAVPMNQRLAELLPPYVNYLVVPVFAVANAGVALSGDVLAGALGSNLTWGIVAGLVLGKLLGVTGAAVLVQRYLPSSRVPGLDLPRIAGVGALSGMGFTISLLVVELALDDSLAQDEARVGVLLASTLALGLAWTIFRIGDHAKPLPTPAGTALQRDVDLSRDHVRGPVDAPSTVVVYAAIDVDYRTRTAEALTEVREQLGDELRIVFRHHTTVDEAMTRALALEAAAEQGRFWDMHDALVQRTCDTDVDTLTDIAGEIGLDRNRFERTLTRGEGRTRVEDDNLDASAAGLPATPVLYAQGVRVRGPANSWYLTELLRKSLQREGDGPHW
ncbi:Na+/H+ antiporter NhaA [Nocardia donostiensis]|uniref:Na(+)/H(+) antiporter NhaA n=1 Tax=Nocardia donostiensis TaxID=1538463 RepID=A0A1V2TB95_9NOCA|nr:Na+/H+ antiporter NhaA [Nocardia donostiensis]ONM46728.1 Na+/H+ antiporter NhaA [Nocardia donostiensis]OQS12808.1 Na+/H+ antiporter NhaA [Nocardia donostiensis]OQS19360.1 Na+/H+ antiporter NhaA [Nocardia donostiensis]